MTLRARVAAWMGRAGHGAGREDPMLVPPDPRTRVAGPLDPRLAAIRDALVRHRRRLWLRRMARRAWLVLAGTMVAEAVLLAMARLVPI